MFFYILQAAALGMACGIIGWVYINFLAFEPILNWWFRFGIKYTGRWFHKPIWGCDSCFSGQLSLWSFLFLVILPPLADFWRHGGGQAIWTGISIVSVIRALFGLIFTICAGIFTAMRISAITNKQ